MGNSCAPPLARSRNSPWAVSPQACLRLSGTTPPLSASLVMTSLCSQIFISAEPSRLPLYPSSCASCLRAVRLESSFKSFIKSTIDCCQLSFSLCPSAIFLIIPRPLSRSSPCPWPERRPQLRCPGEQAPRGQRRGAGCLALAEDAAL